MSARTSFIYARSEAMEESSTTFTYRVPRLLTQWPKRHFPLGWTDPLTHWTQSLWRPADDARRPLCRVCPCLVVAFVSACPDRRADLRTLDRLSVIGHIRQLPGARRAR